MTKTETNGNQIILIHIKCTLQYFYFPIRFSICFYICKMIIINNAFFLQLYLTDLYLKTNV